MAGPSTICVLQFSKSPSLWETTTTSELAANRLPYEEMASYPNLVANLRNVNKLAAVIFSLAGI